MQLAGDGVFGAAPGSRRSPVRVLRTAVDSGVNHLDTSQYTRDGTLVIASASVSQLASYAWGAPT
jgi:aryl-alcohol dehydrogenase-like predicted oxidoreductase